MANDRDVEWLTGADQSAATPPGRPPSAPRRGWVVAAGFAVVVALVAGGAFLAGSSPGANPTLLWPAALPEGLELRSAERASRGASLDRVLPLDRTAYRSVDQPDVRFIVELMPYPSESTMAAVGTPVDLGPTVTAWTTTPVPGSAALVWSTTDASGSVYGTGITEGDTAEIARRSIAGTSSTIDQPGYAPRAGLFLETAVADASWHGTGDAASFATLDLVVWRARWDEDDTGPPDSESFDLGGRPARITRDADGMATAITWTPSDGVTATLRAVDVDDLVAIARSMTALTAEAWADHLRAADLDPAAREQQRVAVRAEPGGDVWAVAERTAGLGAPCIIAAAERRSGATGTSCVRGPFVLAGRAFALVADTVTTATFSVDGEAHPAELIGTPSGASVAVARVPNPSTPDQLTMSTS